MPPPVPPLPSHLDPAPVTRAGRAAGWLLLLLLAACDRLPDEPAIVQQADAFSQGNRVYANVKLSTHFQEQVRALLAHGESVVGSYRLRLLRERTLWPDLLLHELAFRRRLRPLLILQRYDLEEIKEGGSENRATSDLEDALRFLGQPRYLPLIASGLLEMDEHYRLEVRFRLEREGDSRTFRLLQRLLSFGEPLEHTLNTALPRLGR